MRFFKSSRPRTNALSPALGRSLRRLRGWRAAPVRPWSPSAAAAGPRMALHVLPNEDPNSSANWIIGTPPFKQSHDDFEMVDEDGMDVDTTPAVGAVCHKRDQVHTITECVRMGVSYDQTSVDECRAPTDIQTVSKHAEYTDDSEPENEYSPCKSPESWEQSPIDQCRTPTATKDVATNSDYFDDSDSEYEYPAGEMGSLTHLSFTSLEFLLSGRRPELFSPPLETDCHPRRRQFFCLPTKALVVERVTALRRRVAQVIPRRRTGVPTDSHVS